MTVLDKFLRYTKIDTQSDSASMTTPSTLKQLDLSNLLVKELNQMGLESVLKDGYVYTKIAKNTNKDSYSIGFIAHVDTAPDAPGNNVKPRIIKNYDGKTIVLNDFYQMDPVEFEVLNEVIGDDLVVTDGNTLLGADDKAGVAEIMAFAQYLVNNPSIEHGDIFICFTPDEEIGRGTDSFDFDLFKADFAYTLDGGKVGGIEFENFNAASADIKIIGKSIHPGTAKNKMINANLLAMEFHQLLPVFLNPAYTEGYEGFNHLSELSGSVEEAELNYIIRNHDKALFLKQKEDFQNITNYLNNKYGYEAFKLEIKDSYYNMKEFFLDKMFIIDLAVKATIAADIKPFHSPIRGGTDGAMLTYKGLPTPNLGTGGYNYHGRYEFLSVNQMHKAVEIIINIAKFSLKNC